MNHESLVILWCWWLGSRYNRIASRIQLKFSDSATAAEHYFLIKSCTYCYAIKSASYWWTWICSSSVEWASGSTRIWIPIKESRYDMIHGWLLRRHCIWRLLSRYVQFFRITPLFVRSEIIDDAIPDRWSSLTKQMTFRDMVFFAGMGGGAQTDCSMTSWTHTKLYVKLFDYLSLHSEHVVILPRSATEVA